VSQPPSVGPAIGPRMTAALHMLMTRGISRCGYMSSIVVCDSGISDAPARPWSSR
jgi:hypothetical protein